MAVLAMVKLKGEPQQLLDAKNELMDPVAEEPFREHGHICQVVVEGEDGLLVFNLWRDAEGRDRANGDPAMQRAREQIIERTGTEAEFANWAVVQHKRTAEHV